MAKETNEAHNMTRDTISKLFKKAYNRYLEVHTWETNNYLDGETSKYLKDLPVCMLENSLTSVTSMVMFAVEREDRRNKRNAMLQTKNLKRNEIHNPSFHPWM